MKLPIFGDETDRYWRSIHKQLKRTMRGKSNSGWDLYWNISRSVGFSPAFEKKDSLCSRYGVELFDALNALVQAKKIDIVTVRDILTRFTDLGPLESLSEEAATSYVDLLTCLSQHSKTSSADGYFTECLEAVVPFSGGSETSKLPHAQTNDLLCIAISGFVQKISAYEEEFISSDYLLRYLGSYKDQLTDDFYSHSLQTVKNFDSVFFDKSTLSLVVGLYKLATDDTAKKMESIIQDHFSKALVLAYKINDDGVKKALAEKVQLLTDYGFTLDDPSVSILDTETVRLPEGAELSAMVVCFNAAAKANDKKDYVTLSRLNIRDDFCRLKEVKTVATINNDFKAGLIEKYQDSGAALAQKLMINAPRIGHIT